MFCLMLCIDVVIRTSVFDSFWLGLWVMFFRQNVPFSRPELFAWAAQQAATVPCL